MPLYDIGLAGGKTVQWDGETGVDACQRYAEAHPGETPYRWREAERHGLHIGVLPIVEPTREYTP